LIRSLASLTNEAETVAKAQVFLEHYPDCVEIPEVRFILASSLKKLGHNPESMKQVLLLLQSQQENVRKNPETWITGSAALATRSPTSSTRRGLPQRP